MKCTDALCNLWRESWLMLFALFFLSALTPAFGQADPADPCDTACATSSISLNTGLNHETGGIYPVGGKDEYWTVISDGNSANGPAPRPALAVAPSTYWAPPQGGSQWIAGTPTADNVHPGPVRYQRCICICGTSSKLITFTLNIMSDDNSSVFLNGALVGSVPALSSTPTTITFARSLAPGMHCIEIEVHNPIPYHSGLNVSGTATGSGLVRPVCCGRSKTPTPDSDCDVSSVTMNSDHTWSIISDASGGVVPRCATVITTAQPFPNWETQPPAHWIGVNADSGETTVNGFYTFQKCFCVSEQTTLKLDISAYADDYLEIKLNGTTIPTPAGWAGDEEKTVSMYISVPRGCHCIQFKVENSGGRAMGLNAIIKLTGPNLLKESCCYCASCPCPPQPIILPPAYHQEGEGDHSDHSHVSGVESATATSSFSPMLLSVPNPTNGETVFKYQIPRESDVTLELYNTAGERIETLDTGWKLAGSHSLSYDVTRLPAGTYHLRLMFGSQSYSVPVSVR